MERFTKEEFEKLEKEASPSEVGNFIEMKTLAPNFYKVICKNGAIYISYDKVIAYIDFTKKDFTAFIDYLYYDCSKTTMKHLCLALNEKSIKDIRRKINNAEYVLASLNNRYIKGVKNE